VQRAHEIVRRDLSDERPAAGPRLHDAQELERAQRLADGGPGYLELLGQRALGGQLVAGPELALFEQRLDLLDDALVEPAAPDRLNDGQLGTSLYRGQVV